jgi:3-isopropylmalate/(R)-2-methylmalate dehydratase small subunit
VWALQNYGFKAVISPRFGDIFRGNSGKAGLLTCKVDEKVVQRLWDHLEENPGSTVTVDLESRTVRAGEGPDAIEDSFDIDDYTRWRLLQGLDDIGITLGHDADIASYEARRPTWKAVTLRS